MNEGKLRQNPLLAWREIEGEVVIISPEDSFLHELNATASFIWKQLDGERTAPEIAELVATEYDVTPRVASADTEELVSQLEAKGLLLRSPASRAENP